MFAREKKVVKKKLYVSSKVSGCQQNHTSKGQQIINFLQSILILIASCLDHEVNKKISQTQFSEDVCCNFQGNLKLLDRKDILR